MSYLKQTGQLTPEWQMKLENAINAGYQRVLTFRTGGGFDWYGHSPAKTILTAYGILMLHDMNEVYPIDRTVIDDARRVLYDRQHGDGSWYLDIPMGTWHQLGNASLPLTAYVAWTLLESSPIDNSIARAVTYLENNRTSADDPYTLALVGNALALAKSPHAAEVLSKLESMATRTKGEARWTSRIQGAMYSRGDVADIETTALAALALVRGGRSVLIDEALTFLIRSKDASGGWHSTQSTILAIKALLEASKTPRVTGSTRVSLRVNGTLLDFEPVTPENERVMQQLTLTPHLKPGENVIELEADSDVPLTYQLASRHYLPWNKVPPPTQPPVVIESKYDKTTLSLRDELRCDVSIRFNAAASFMLIADLGIPAGFVPRSDAFDKMVAAKTLDKYTITGRQITLYFGEVKPGQRIDFYYTLVPRFLIRTTPPPSRAYEYYTPANSGSSVPIPLEVKD
jgi:hypothetical protein